MAEAFWRLRHRILYIECGGDARPFRRVLGQGKQSGHTVVADLERRGFFVMRAAHLPAFPRWYPEFARHWNASRTSARAAKFLAASDAARVIVCHYNWMCPDLFASARETVCHVYECTDDHTEAPGLAGRRFLRRHVRRNERRLFERAHLTVFPSPLLADAHPEAAHGAVLPVGVDVDHFSRRSGQDPHARLDLPERSPDRPRVGFLGTLTDRTDWAMLRAAAAQTPAWQWVVAGPSEGARPRGPENMCWLGGIRYEGLPAWLQHWDVGILAHTSHTDFNRRSWPLRLLEYLAAGLPVASTDIPAAREVAAQLPGVVRVSPEHTSAQFVETVKAALAVPAWKREAGRSFARRYSWTQRAREILDRLPGFAR